MFLILLFRKTTLLPQQTLPHLSNWEKLGRNVFDDTILNKQGSDGAEDVLRKQSLLLENKNTFLPRVKLWPVNCTSLANRSNGSKISES